MRMAFVSPPLAPPRIAAVKHEVFRFKNSPRLSLKKTVPVRDSKALSAKKLFRFADGLGDLKCQT